ncbi:hypothetical protein ACWD4T_37640 [Streptomyces umbrinus]
MAPADRRTQRLVPGEPRPGGGDEQVEPGVEACQEPVEGEAAQPHRGQFQGQRYPVEAGADRRHVRPVGVGQRERRHGCRGAGREQRHRVVAFAERQRRHGQQMLAGHAQWLTAGGQNP